MTIPPEIKKFRTIEHRDNVYVERYYLDFREYGRKEFIPTHIKICDPVVGVRVLINKNGIREALRTIDRICYAQEMDEISFNLQDTMFVYDALLMHEAMEAGQMCEDLADLSYHHGDMHAYYQNYRGDHENGFDHISALITDAIDMYYTGARVFGPHERNLFNCPLSNFISVDTASMGQIDPLTWAARNGVLTDKYMRALTQGNLKKMPPINPGKVDLDLIDAVIDGDAHRSLDVSRYQTTIRMLMYAPFDELRVTYILHKYRQEYTYTLQHGSNRYQISNKVLTEFLSELGKALLTEVDYHGEEYTVCVELTPNFDAVITISTNQYAKYNCGYLYLAMCLLANDNLCHTDTYGDVNRRV